MRGKRGIQVTLTVLRSGWKDPRNFAMLRDIIKIPQRRRFLLEPGYGVLKVKRFTDNIDREVDAQLRRWKKSRVAS